MKVILKKDNTIKDVNEGYARNYLLPKGLAIIATADEIKKRDSLLKQAEANRKVKEVDEEKRAHELDGKQFIIKTNKIGSNGKLNGSITAKEISEKTQIDKLYLVMDAPIKEPGAHVIPLKIGKNHARITIIIEKEGSQ